MNDNTSAFPNYEQIELTEQVPLEFSRPQYAVPMPGMTPWGPIPEQRVSRTPRPSTIIWGFILLATGFGNLAAGLGTRVDYGLATILLLAMAGLTLVGVAIFSGLRRSRTP